MSLFISIFDKIISIFLENSGITFNICILVILILLISEHIEENAKKKKHRAKSYGTKKNNQLNYNRRWL